MPSIETLTKRMQERQSQRQADEDRLTMLSERNKLIDGTPQYEVMDFWCTTCKRDFECVGMKMSQTDWHDPDARIAYYEALPTDPRYCHRSRRYITDKFCDPYYKLSRKLRRQRIDQFRDMIQPTQDGFKMLYGENDRKVRESWEHDLRRDIQASAV